MSDAETPIVALAEPPSRLRTALFAILTAQYILIALGVGLPLAAMLRFFVTPQIVAKFEAVTIALGR